MIFKIRICTFQHTDPVQALLVFMYIFIRNEVTVNGLVLLISIPGGSDSKASAYNAEDLGSIPGLGRSPGEGNGNPLQYSCLENPMDGGAW